MKIITFLLGVLGTSLFVGMLISWSGGSIFPSLYNVAAPIVCNGKFSTETEEYRPRPGEVDTATTISCQDSKTGTTTDISGVSVIAAGFVYSALVFVPALLISIRRRKTAAVQAAAFPEQAEVATRSTIPIMPRQGIKDSDDPAEKLRKVNELRDADLITEEEYQAKRAEILSKV